MPQKKRKQIAEVTGDFVSVSESSQLAKIIEFLVRRGYVNEGGFVQENGDLCVDSPITVVNGEAGNMISELAMLANSFNYDVDAYFAHWEMNDYGFDAKKTFWNVMMNLRFWSNGTQSTKYPERINKKIFNFASDYKFEQGQFNWDEDETKDSKDFKVPEPQN